MKIIVCSDQQFGLKSGSHLNDPDPMTLAKAIALLDGDTIYIHVPTTALRLMMKPHLLEYLFARKDIDIHFVHPSSVERDAEMIINMRKI